MINLLMLLFFLYFLCQDSAAVFSLHVMKQQLANRPVSRERSTLLFRSAFVIWRLM